MSGVPWHSPLGGLIEARGVLQVARKSVENEKAINGHIAGNPYDVAISALNFALGSLDGVIAPTPAQGLDAATIERCARRLHGENFYLNGGDETDDGWDDCPEDCKEDRRKMVRSVLSALNTASPTTRGEDARLREALEPFANLAKYMEGRNGIVTGWNHDRVTYEDFRRARAALQGDAAHTSQEKGE